MDWQFSHALDVAKFQDLQLSQGAAPVFDVPNKSGVLFVLPHEKQITDLGEIVDSSMKYSAQVLKEIFKARQGLAILNKTYFLLTS